MANKYRFDRDSITVNGRTFPARYEVMERDETRGGYFTVVILATVDGGEAVRIEVPAGDKQHAAALAAAQMDAGNLADMAQDVQQQEQATAAEPVTIQQDGAQDERRADISTDEKERQTMKQGKNEKVYNVFFTDHPTQAATFSAPNKREAEKLARLYIRQWGLDAKIDRVECVPPLEKREGWTRPEYRRDGAQAVTDGAEPVQQGDAPTAAEPVTVQQDAPEAAQDGARAVSNIDAPTAADAAQDAPTAAQDAPEEPGADVLEEIGGAAVPAQDAPTAAQDPTQDGAPVVDPKSAHGPIPEKTWRNETISGNGWSIVFDAGCNRTRVIIADPVKAAARPIVEAAGFYYSRALDSWNKKLTHRAHRAALALADNLRAALA